jgi:hypothetical protein
MRINLRRMELSTRTIAGSLLRETSAPPLIIGRECWRRVAEAGPWSKML